MRLSIHAHFDGRVIIPDEPLDLPAGQTLSVEVVIPDHPTQPWTIEERREAMRRFFSRSVGQVNLSDESLRREAIYEDRA